MVTREPCAANWLRPPGPIAPGLKIGLLGGSFNPAHEGHLHVSEVALKRLGLDYVWWLVAPQNPLKPTSGMAPLRERLARATQAFERNPRILVFDLETALGTRYTIDTVSALQQRFPGVRFVWLMGTDNLDGFQRWRRWQELAERIPIAGVMRPASPLPPPGAKPIQLFAPWRIAAPPRLPSTAPPAIAVLDGARSGASATQIRAKKARA